MKAVRGIVGTCVPLDRSDVDTDQIIPASWLKRVERTGFGVGLFSAWRESDPSFPLNLPEYQGASILVYPEGTRAQEGGPILPFKKGPFVMAIQAGVPIVPVAIDGSSRLLPKSSLRVTPGTVRFIMGEPIPTAGLTQDDREDLMRRVRDAIIDLHLRIGGAGGDKGEAVACAGLEGVAQQRRRRSAEAQPINVAQAG